MRTPPTLLRTCVLLLQLAMIAGCGITRNDYSSRQFSVQPAVSSVAVDGSVTMKATLTTNGTVQDVTAQTSWTVSNPSMATVQNNVVQGKTVGKVTVTGSYNPSSSSSASANVVTPTSSLTSSNGANSTASTTVTITPAPSVVTWQQPASVTAGTVLGPTQLDATANVPGTFTYNPAAGAVLQAGTQTVTATFTPNDSKDFASATATQTISVTGSTPPPPTLTALQISGSSTSLQTGQTVQLTATGTYSDNSTKDLTSTVIWNSSNKAVVSVTSGTVSGVAAGTTQISASYNGISSASTTITVSAPAAILTAIQISGSTTVGAGASTQLTATGTYSDTTTKDMTSSATWASSQYSTAAVQAGSVTGVNAGTATITASLNGVTASTTITVSSGNVIQIDPSMAESDIQTKINGGQAGDTVSFAPGTYSLAAGPGSNGASLVLKAGLSYQGPSSGSPAIITISGTALHPLMEMGGNGITIKYLTFDQQGIFVDDGASVTIDNNVFQNIPCTNSQPNQSAIDVAGGLNNSDISYNTFQHLGDTGSCATTEDNSSTYGAGAIGLYGFHNLTITHNTFANIFEPIGITISNSNEYDGAGGVIEYNTFTGIHRIALEMLGTSTNPSGLIVAYNNYSNALNPWAGTFGLSLTAGQNMVVHDNVINGNIPSSNQYVPYGIEIAGYNTQAYNNTIEGYWGWGFAIGTNQPISITNNKICGPAMNSAGPNTGSSPAAGNGGGFISWEAAAIGGSTFTGNTTSGALTCGP